MKKNLLFTTGKFKINNKFSKTFIVFTLLLLSSYNMLYAQCSTLVWQDEFNGTTVDASKWKSISGNGCPSLCGFGNAEAQRFDPNQASISKVGADSYLKIEAKYAPDAAFPAQPYSSAKLTTEGKYFTKYGKFEARMKLSSGMGAWPAFWMLPEGGAGTWPYTGEIDIMEAKHRNPKDFGGTIHYDAGGHQYTYRDYVSTTDLSADFHIYAIEWGPDIIKWFIDGILFHTATPKTTVGGSWPFNDRDFYIILNLAVGSAGTPYTNVNGKGVEPVPTDYPTSLLVDYVRVYSGSYNYGVAGDAKVYNNETNKVYSIASIAGASYSWTVPAGATITSGQGTNAINVNWGTTGGDVAVATTVANCPNQLYKLPVVTESILPIEKVYEDFEANRLVYPKKTGVLTEAIVNPSQTGLNTSTLVGRYVRNITELYDVMNVKNITITNANDFVYGRKKISFDVYTAAPVGTKILMQLENSLDPHLVFPQGIHSKYNGVTTVQNQWETIEFQFDATLDANTSPFSVDTAVFLFESGVYSNKTYYFDNLLVRAKPEAPVVSTTILEDYDGIRKITKGTSTGVYTADVPNPATSIVNNSVKVAKYVRNVSEQYDVLFFNPNNTIDDAGLFKDQTYKIQMEIYSTAPVGTSITLSFENSLATTSTNYPAGRNSRYLAKTTKQNQWETVTFYYNDAPDTGTSNFAVNQMVFLFNSGNKAGDTYYMDNIRIVSTKLPVTYTTGTIYEDYENTHNISFKDANGTYTPTFTNPNSSGINSSTNVGKYVRNATNLYDNIAFNTTMTDIADFKIGTKKFAMDLYTSAPVGTIVSWQAESTASTPGNYPVGRHSIYQAVVKETNTWHTLEFSYASSPDGATLNSEVNRFVFLFNPGTSTSDTYYFDNLRSLVGNTLVTTNFDFATDTIKIYPNPANQFIKVNVPTNSQIKGFRLNDLSGRIVLEKQLDTNLENYTIDISSVPSGLYLLNLKSDTKTWTKKVIKE